MRCDALDVYAVNRRFTKADRVIFEEFLNTVTREIADVLKGKHEISSSLATAYIAESCLYSISIGIDLCQVLTNSRWDAASYQSRAAEDLLSLSARISTSTPRGRRSFLGQLLFVSPRYFESSLPDYPFVERYITKLEGLGLGVSVAQKLAFVERYVISKFSKFKIQKFSLGYCNLDSAVLSLWNKKSAHNLSFTEKKIIENKPSFTSAVEITHCLSQRLNQSENAFAAYKTLFPFIKRANWILCVDIIVALFLYHVPGFLLDKSIYFYLRSQAFKEVQSLKINLFLNTGGFFRPHVVLYCDVCTELCIPRIRAQAGANEIYETSGFLEDAAFRGIQFSDFHWGFSKSYGSKDSIKVPSPHLSLIRKMVKYNMFFELFCIRRRGRRKPNLKVVLFFPALDQEAVIEKGLGFTFSELPSQRIFEDKMISKLVGFFGKENIYIKTKGGVVWKTEQLFDNRFLNDRDFGLKFLPDSAASSCISFGDILITSSPSTILAEILCSTKPFILLLNEEVYKIRILNRDVLEKLDRLGLVCREPSQIVPVCMRLVDEASWEKICFSSELRQVRYLLAHSSSHWRYWWAKKIVNVIENET